MKRILLAGERYGLFFGLLILKDYYVLKFKIKTQSVFSHLFIAKFIVLFFTSCGTFNHMKSFEPRTISTIGKYEIGDKLPKDFIIGFDPWDTTQIITLSDLRGKSVILDLWATWCGNCIHYFPLMDSLQLSYQNNLSIILVNLQGRDNPKKVRDFLQNHEYSHLKFVIENKPYRDSFVFRTIPHYIWIDKNRRIKAFTDTDSFTPENLNSLINGLLINTPIKLTQ